MPITRPVSPRELSPGFDAAPRYGDVRDERYLHFDLRSLHPRFSQLELVVAPGTRQPLEALTPSSRELLSLFPGPAALPLGQLSHSAPRPVALPRHYMAPWYVLATDLATGEQRVALCGCAMPDHGRRPATGVHLAQTAFEMAVYMIQHCSELFTGYTSPYPDEDIAGRVVAIISAEPSVADFASWLQGVG
ncbi:MAG TPA: hypothetical protein VFV33_09750, partial [Gemmatimonadaceae bacterium]|nr:hypothetical protein [Gemmatimonadaceae bacterium]